jgi:hypothetical protein
MRRLGWILGIATLAACGGSAALPGNGPHSGLTSYNLAVELDPPTGSTTLAQDEIGSLNGGAALQASPYGTIPTVAFDQPVVFSGNVRWDPSDTASIDAVVLATRASKIPGAPWVSYTAVSKPNIATGRPSFEMLVIPGTYSVTIVPIDPTVQAQTPPTTLSETITASELVDLPIGGSAAVAELQGNVLNADTTPAAGWSVDVQALPANGLPFDGAVISSTAITAADGSFALAFPRSASGSNYVVRVGPPDSKTPLPEVYYQRNVDLSSAPGPTAPFGTFTLPTFPSPIAYQFSVGGTSQAGGNQPATAATVNFEADGASTSLNATWSAWRYQSTGAVGSDGSLTVALLPGTPSRDYNVTVVTPPDSSFADLAGMSLTVSDPLTIYRVDLSARVYLTGAVLDASGAPAEGIDVSADQDAAYLATSHVNVQQTPPTIQAITASDGSFGLWVDPQYGSGPSAINAQYDLNLTPPADSNLPAWSSDAAMVNAPPANQTTTDMICPSGWQSSGGSQCTFNLPPGLPVSGQVVDANGNPVVGATVKVFALPQPGSSCACTLPPRLRATATTDQQGVYTIILADPAGT